MGTLRTIGVTAVMMAAALGISCGADDGAVVVDARPRIDATPVIDAQPPPTSCDPATRQTRDRIDDATQPQVHVVYAIPSDGVDRSLDTDGTLAGSVASWAAWLRDQTGGPGLRLDTCSDQLDITFVQLSKTDAEIAARGAFVRDELEAMLAADVADNKLYAVYYDGSSTFSCGGGAWPPDLVGRVAALYLRGAPPGAPGCDTNVFAGADAPPGYLEFAMLHEIIHTLGFVADCAPNHTLRGHSSDSPTDLMYAGDQPWVPTTLDVGADDYYGSVGTCPDLAASALMDPTPPYAALPPGW